MDFSILAFLARDMPASRTHQNIEAPTRTTHSEQILSPLRFCICFVFAFLGVLFRSPRAAAKWGGSGGRRLQSNLLISFLLFANPEKLSPSLTQWGVLIWLGVVASGLGYFLWNKGACLVDAGILAIMNNALVPAGLIVNLIIWEKTSNYLLLFVGSLIIGLSLYLHYYFMKLYEKSNRTLE